MKTRFEQTLQAALPQLDTHSKRVARAAELLATLRGDNGLLVFDGKVQVARYLAFAAESVQPTVWRGLLGNVMEARQQATSAARRRAGKARARGGRRDGEGRFLSRRRNFS